MILPAADTVVGAEVALVVSEAVGGGAVPLGGHEHVVAHLFWSKESIKSTSKDTTLKIV